MGISKTTAIIKSRLPQTAQATGPSSQYSLQPVRIYARNQESNPIAYLRPSRSSNHNRWFSSGPGSRISSTKAPGPRYDRTKYPTSKTSKAISQRGAAPFASTLRPNLTGGTLPRSAGGYCQGARHFSHTSGAQAQVVQNVSAGIRAFIVNGGKARFDGVNPTTGEKRFRSVSQTEDAVLTHRESSFARSIRGTNLEFKLCPTITALSPAFSSAKQDAHIDTTSLRDIDLLENLATDFARALKDLAAVLTDLRHLSAFGDLPICLTTNGSGPTLTVRFSGCDGDLVSRLCDEVGVHRGMIVEDESWSAEKDVEMALLFPFAPVGAESGAASEYAVQDEYFGQKPLDEKHGTEALDWRQMLSPPIKTQSLSSIATSTPFPPNADTPSGYESLRDSDFASDDPYYRQSVPPSTISPRNKISSADYEGVEGIYKFLQVCEEARR